MGRQEGERWIKAFQSNIPAAPFLEGEVDVKSSLVEKASALA